MKQRISQVLNAFLVLTFAMQLWLAGSETLANRYWTLGFDRLIACVLIDSLSESIYRAAIAAGLISVVAVAVALVALRLGARSTATLVVPSAVLAGFVVNRGHLPKSISPVSWNGRVNVLAICLLLAPIVWTLVPFIVARSAGSPARRRLLAAAAIASVAGIASFQLLRLLPLVRAEARGPNVILIVLDTVRRSNLSTYGYDRATTPNLTRIASQGAVFDRAYAQAPWTGPSHASMFTGLYPTQHNVEKAMSRAHVTVAELLAEAGYDTVAFVNNAALTRSRGFAQGFREYYETWRSGMRRRFGDVALADKGAAATAVALKHWLSRRAGSRRPFFLFVNYLEAHMPYDPPENYRFRFLPRGTPIPERVRSYDYVKFLAGGYRMSTADFEAAEALYDAELAYLDERLGELFDWLNSCGALDDTLFIVTADHGEHFGEHGLIGHQFALYEHLLHVPLVVRYPQRVVAGTRSADPVELVDLFKTVLDAAAVSPRGPEPTKGRSLFSGATRRDVFAEYRRTSDYAGRFRREFPDFDASRFDVRLASVRSGDFKYISSSRGDHELYDLTKDPGELHNLKEAKPDVAKRLELRLLAWRKALGESSDEDDAADVTSDEEQIEHLRSLGYVE